MDCLFCKIAKGLVPSEKVMETSDIIVIKDVNPQAPLHLLAIPKKHYATLNDVDDPELLSALLLTIKEAARDAGVSESGYRTVINTNSEGGQVVFHLHVHLLGGTPLGPKMG